MKDLIIVGFFVVFSGMTVKAQGTGYFLLDFEDLSMVEHFLTIDTVSNPNNSWQIGTPGKPTVDGHVIGHHIAKIKGSSSETGCGDKIFTASHGKPNVVTHICIPGLAKSA